MSRKAGWSASALRPGPGSLSMRLSTSRSRRGEPSTTAGKRSLAWFRRVVGGYRVRWRRATPFSAAAGSVQRPSRRRRQPWHSPRPPPTTPRATMRGLARTSAPLRVAPHDRVPGLPAARHVKTGSRSTRAEDRAVGFWIGGAPALRACPASSQGKLVIRRRAFGPRGKTRQVGTGPASQMQRRVATLSRRDTVATRRRVWLTF